MNPRRRFDDRRDAGAQLADLVADLVFDRPLVLALPRGGVPVAAVVADRIGAPLDVWVARKVGAPGHEEYGIGAIAEGGGAVFDDRALEAFGIDVDRLGQLVEAERHELLRRVQRYRDGDDPPDVAGRDVVLVDDGLATGVTARAAIAGIRKCSPATLTLAVPVAAADSAASLAETVDVLSVVAPSDFSSVGQWYVDFSQTTDDEVVRLLESHGVGTGGRTESPHRPPTANTKRIRGGT